jgi:hypothetical protein
MAVKAKKRILKAATSWKARKAVCGEGGAGVASGAACMSAGCEPVRGGGITYVTQHEAAYAVTAK